MKKLLTISLLIVVMLSIVAAPSVYAASDEAIKAATDLHNLGLFSGVGKNADGSTNYDLDRTMTRAEAVTMLVRLLGKDEAAKAETWQTPFTDVAEWAKPYVGYAYANKLTGGTSKTTFSGSDNTTTAQYLTFVLRALGYSSDSDFKWDKAWELTNQLGITSGQYDAVSDFMRGDAVIISRAALSARVKGTDLTLLDSLKSEKTTQEESKTQEAQKSQDETPAAGYVFHISDEAVKSAINDGKADFSTVSSKLSKYMVKASSTSSYYAEQVAKESEVTVLCPRAYLMRQSCMKYLEFKEYSFSDGRAYCDKAEEMKYIGIEVHAVETQYSTTSTFSVGVMQDGNIIQSAVSGLDSFPSKGSGWPNFPKYYRAGVVGFSQDSINISKPIQIIVRYITGDEITYTINLQDYV
ncbi:MAG: S-layer homology domain-containing protein [Paludibacteraceae bacterium]|nr:S-layer homology domain-containing protein [Paludibacteraceae bacterium]